MITALFLLVSCTSKVPQLNEKNAPAHPGNSQSLLLSTPFIGEETSIRNPPPAPVRVLLAGVSMAGWLVPPEKILRFPVDPENGARLYFQLGIAAGPYKSLPPGLPPLGDLRPPGTMHEPSPQVGGGAAFPSMEPSNPTAGSEGSLPSPGDLSLKVEFVTTGSDGNPTGKPLTIFELSSEDFISISEKWHPVDVPLDKIANAKGELRFIAEGSKAGDMSFRVLWGQPALYVPRKVSHKNILLIGVDTLRCDAISPLGGRLEITPNIQALSDSGTLYTQVHAQAPWTLPSFASIITGLMPSKSVGAKMSNYIPENISTAGEYLLSEGLTTYTVCSSPWLGNEKSGFQQGMEGLTYIGEQDAHLQINDALKFISSSNEMGRDWFCFVHLMDPHTPYSPPMEYANQFCNDNYTGQYSSSFPEGAWLDPGSRPSPEEIRHVRCLYDSEVANVDAAIKDLLKYLDDQGLTKDTLIIFCSDHGEEFNEHGAFGHGKTQYEEQIHVPLIIKGPGFPSGTRVDNAVANLDIMPTILNYLGITQPDSMTGVPLQNFPGNSANGNRVICGENALTGIDLVYSMNWPYKLILNYKTLQSTLYDLANDPVEANDVSADNPDVSKSLMDALGIQFKPEATSIHVWITGYEHLDHKFTGTIKVPGGIDKIQTFLFESDDSYSVSGDTVSFTISSLVNAQTIPKDELAPPGQSPMPLPIKHMMITPLTSLESVEAGVKMDGRVDDDRFYFRGDKLSYSTGSATIGIGDFPIVPQVPVPTDFQQDCFIMWASPAEQDEAAPSQELDPQTQEQLKAIGYVN